MAAIPSDNRINVAKMEDTAFVDPDILSMDVGFTLTFRKFYVCLFGLYELEI